VDQVAVEHPAGNPGYTDISACLDNQRHPGNVLRSLAAPREVYSVVTQRVVGVTLDQREATSFWSTSDTGTLTRLAGSSWLVFDVLTKPEHVRKWFAPFEDKMTVCSIDLRVGGKYHMVFVTDDGRECSFRGTYLEVERLTRMVETWLFEGWPDAEAVETVELHETDGVTKVKMKLAFRDKAGRDHMTRFDGQEDSWDKMEDYLRSLVDQSGTVSGS